MENGVKNVNINNTIEIGGSAVTEGRTFEGIGVLSAGGTSRLLADYPEQQKNEILDYFFKPNFGTSFHHLKVELGGDENGSVGMEPGHARSKEELDNPRKEYFDRGYQWFILKGAKKRNPDIYLDCLQWGAPDWIGTSASEDPRKVNNEKFYSKDNIDYIIGFINGEKKYHGLEFDFVGTRNEVYVAYDQNIGWIKDLCRAVAENNIRNGLNTKVVGCDDNGWNIADDVAADDELRELMYAMTAHYCLYLGYSEKAVNMKKSNGEPMPLWDSEFLMHLTGISPTHWERAIAMASAVNRNYVVGRVTKHITCNMVTAWPDNMPGAHSSNATTNTPWSGCYDMIPVIWAIAHTGQFTKPGWKYIDGGCGVFLENDKDAGSYVTLKNPSTNDYSIIIDTYRATGARSVKFQLSDGLNTGKVHVWYSNMYEQFIKSPEDITPVYDPETGKYSFTLMLESESIYSLTTTTGQQKGLTKIPEPKPFPLPYYEDFESYKTGAMAKYFHEAMGLFEVAEGGKDGGKCLRQIMKEPSRIAYIVIKNNLALFGDPYMTDYRVSADVYIEDDEGMAFIAGRVYRFTDSKDLGVYYEFPDCMYLVLDKKGAWSLYCYDNEHAQNPFIDPEQGITARDIYAVDNSNVEGLIDMVVASGIIPDGSGWHNLKLVCVGSNITAFIDDIQLASISGYKWGNGSCGIGCGWNRARFDNIKIERAGETEEKTSFITNTLNVGHVVRNGFTGDTGMKITVGNSPIEVKELGRRHIFQNSGKHTLRIIDANTGEELPDSRVIVDMSIGWHARDLHGFIYAKPDSPVKLQANTSYYIVSSEETGGDKWQAWDVTSDFTVTDAASVDSGVFFSDSTWNTSGKSGYSYALLNFRC